MYIRPLGSAHCPTPATQSHRQSRGDQGTLEGHRGVHPTPWQCTCVCVCVKPCFSRKQGGKAFSDYLAQRSRVTEGEATEDAQLCTCLVKTVDFGSVHALFVFCSVIHVQQAIFRFHFRPRALLNIPDVTYDSNSGINVGLSGRWTYDAHVWFFRFSGLAE